MSGEREFRGLIVPGLPQLPPDFAEAFHVELVRRTMELFDQAVWSADAIVTTDEAQLAVSDMRAEQRLREALKAFEAIEPVEPQKVVMNQQHFDYARWLYQRPPAYRGGMDPALFGFPIEIDDTADLPRLESM